MSFQPREAWRGRGRPPTEPSDKVMKLLQQTARTATCVTMQLDDSTTEQDLRELRADLRAAQRQMGGKVHYQKVGKIVRFFWDPKGA
jgi:hypothetical protein